MTSVGIMASSVVVASGPVAGPQTPSNRWLLRSTSYLAAQSITLTGAVAGRLLVATLAARSSAGAPLTPAGWTNVGTILGASGTSSPELIVWARVSAGVETVSFWDATYDANKMLAVEEYDLPLVAGLTTIGGGTNDSGAGTGESCPIVPAGIATTSVLYLAGVAVRDVVTGMTQVQSGWSIPGRWEQNLMTLDGNYVELHTNATYVTDSSEPPFSAAWTGAQRFRGRVIGLEIGTPAPVTPAFKSSLGSATSTTSGSTIAITTTNPIAVGDLVVVRVASDNLSATTPTFTAADSGGNTYTTHRQQAQNATAAAGAANAIIATKATAAIAAGGTITVTLSGAVASRAAYAESFVGFSNTARAVNSVGAASSSSSSSGAVSCQTGDLMIGAAAIESSAAITGDTDTTGGSWSTLVTALANTGTSLTSMTVAGQYRIPNVAVSQTFNTTWTGVTDYASCGVALIPA